MRPMYPKANLDKQEEYSANGTAAPAVVAATAAAAPAVGCAGAAPDAHACAGDEPPTHSPRTRRRETSGAAVPSAATPGQPTPTLGRLEGLGFGGVREHFTDGGAKSHTDSSCLRMFRARQCALHPSSRYEQNARTKRHLFPAWPAPEHTCRHRTEMPVDTTGPVASATPSQAAPTTAAHGARFVPASDFEAADPTKARLREYFAGGRDGGASGRVQPSTGHISPGYGAHFAPGSAPEGTPNTGNPLEGAVASVEPQSPSSGHSSGQTASTEGREYVGFCWSGCALLS